MSLSSPTFPKMEEFHEWFYQFTTHWIQFIRRFSYRFIIDIKSCSGYVIVLKFERIFALVSAVYIQTHHPYDIPCGDSCLVWVLYDEFCLTLDTIKSFFISVLLKGYDAGVSFMTSACATTTSLDICHLHMYNMTSSTISQPYVFCPKACMRMLS